MLGFGTLSMLVGLVLLVVSVRLTTPRHALFIGLSVPVNGAGIALDQGASAPNTVLGFAILVAVGVSAWGWALIGRRSKVSSPQMNSTH